MHEQERKARTTSRFQRTQQGLALCHRVTLDSVAHWWVPARTPTVPRCLYGGRPWVARQQLHVTTHDKRQQNRQGLETNVLSEEPGVDTLGNLHHMPWNWRIICFMTWTKTAGVLYMLDSFCSGFWVDGLFLA